MLKIYTSSTCTPCKMVKQFFDSKGVEYEAYNIDEDEKKQEEAFAISGVMSVPVITDGKAVVVGWNPGALMGLING